MGLLNPLHRLEAPEITYIANYGELSGGGGGGDGGETGHVDGFDGGDLGDDAPVQGETRGAAIRMGDDTRPVVATHVHILLQGTINDDVEDF